jgi:hypothetical protein
VSDEKPPGDAAGQPPRLQPTVMKPTVMKPPKERSRDRKASPPAVPPAPAAPAATPFNAAQPTAMAGVRRERIEAGVAELRALAPNTPAPVCQAALQMIREVVDARMSERKAVLWGHEAQKTYGAHVTGTFSLAQDAVLEQAGAYVHRMTTILGSIDLMAVCGHGRGSLLASLTKSMNARIDTPRELSAGLDELRLLLDRTGAAIDRLLQLKERLQQHADAIARVEVEIEAAALAALFLSAHFAGKKPELARLFTDRSMSLTATLAQVRQSDQVHRLQLDQPLQLIAAIQNVALVSLPGCVAGMAALLTLLSTKGVSPTEARDMSYQLRDLHNRLTT